MSWIFSQIFIGTFIELFPFSPEPKWPSGNDVTSRVNPPVLNPLHSSLDCACDAGSQETFTSSRSQRFSPVFYSINCIILDFTCRSMVHLEYLVVPNFTVMLKKKWINTYYHCIRGFPGGAVVKESACQYRGCKRREFDHCTGKIPWRRKWQPTPVFLRGAWWAAVHWLQNTGRD